MKNLDRETYSFTLTELASMTGVHRQTVAKRLVGLSPEPGSHGKRKCYFVVDALDRIYLSGDLLEQHIRKIRAQADAQELKNDIARGDVVDRQFCMFAFLRLAGDIRSLLGGIPLSMRKRFPELESHHIDFLKRDIVKVMDKAEGLDELLPGLLEEYQR